MATSDVKVDEGSAKNLATYEVTEDAETKQIGRAVLNKSDGTEIGTTGAPVNVALPTATVTTLTPPAAITGFATETTLALIKSTDGIKKITDALPAGSNAIGKLAANSGVDIGDVDVTSQVPGVGATNLGKAEDATHSSGDTGVLMLGVSNENSTALAAASGDYTPIAVNRYGRIYHTAIPPSHASSNGTPITATTTSVISAPSAGSHLRVMRMHMSNGGSTATWVSIRDGVSGTQFYRTYLPQNGIISLNLNASGPLDLTTATRLDIVLSAAGSVEYTIDYIVVAD